MSEQVSAAIHIQGPTIRCAEVVREPSALDLRRFGHRTFEFDVARALWNGGSEADGLDRVGAAAREELEGTDAAEVRVVVHPLDAYSFFTPISAELSERDRMRQVIQQAALLTGIRSPDSLRITPRSVRTVDPGTGGAIEWIHVLAVPKAVRERMEALVSGLSVQEHVQMVSTEAAARLMGYTEGQETGQVEAPSVPSYRLAVGQYPSHTEYTLTHDQTWYHAHATREAGRPENQIYYAVGVLNRLGIPLEDIDRLFVYGADADPETFETFEAEFDCVAELLDPFQVLRQFSERPPREALGSFVPCIGGTLDDGPR